MSQTHEVQERILNPIKGLPILILNVILIIVSIVSIFFGIALLSTYEPSFWKAIPLIVGIIYIVFVSPFIFAGIRSLKPNEAVVLTLFGDYHGTIKKEGLYFVNPFSVSFNPSTMSTSTGELRAESSASTATELMAASANLSRKKISLKAMTLNNSKQKVNDQLGNPIIIGIVVIWRVVNTAKAVFNVDNYTEFLSIQADTSLRDIVRLYPYDLSESNSNKSLRSSSQEVAEDLQQELQRRVEVAGLEIMDARITNLAYASEIASAMLQRQQASAIIDAKQMIVEGAVSMVDMALEKLESEDIVNMDNDQKAKLVSNLLVVLVGSKDVQPVVHSDNQ
ncbi:MAG: SPFH domain-containing protein [Erysipelothrix sp.]|nr:SPFH domain-containing protein [Erysipelothrix sp.]